MDAYSWHARFSQQASWTAQLRRYLLERAGVNKGDRILEVGCGTGAVLGALIQEINPHRLFGLDLNYSYLTLATRNAPQARLIQADAHTLPFPNECFDIVFCHFLLLWVKDPALTVKEMARITRQRGWIMALAEPDYGGRIDYPEKLAKIGKMQELALQQQGAETRMGRRLASLFTAAGVHSVLTGVLGGEWGAQHAEAHLQQEWKVLEDDLREWFKPEELSTFIEMDRRAYEKGERILFVPTFYAIGQK